MKLSILKIQEHVKNRANLTNRRFNQSKEGWRRSIWTTLEFDEIERQQNKDDFLIPISHNVDLTHPFQQTSFHWFRFVRYNLDLPHTYVYDVSVCIDQLHHMYLHV